MALATLSAATMIFSTVTVVFSETAGQATADVWWSFTGLVVGLAVGFGIGYQMGKNK